MLGFKEIALALVLFVIFVYAPVHFIAIIIVAGEKINNFFSGEDEKKEPVEWSALLPFIISSSLSRQP